MVWADYERATVEAKNLVVDGSKSGIPKKK